MIKAFRSHFKHFWRLLGKNFLFFTPSKTDGRVPSQQGAPTTRNLTSWQVSKRTYVQKLLVSMGVVIEHNSDLQSRRGGGRKGIWVWPKGEIHPFVGGGV